MKKSWGQRGGGPEPPWIRYWKHRGTLIPHGSSDKTKEGSVMYLTELNTEVEVVEVALRVM